MSGHYLEKSYSHLMTMLLSSPVAGTGRGGFRGGFRGGARGGFGGPPSRGGYGGRR